MSEPFTWQTLDVIAARVAAISTANGYYTNAGAIVDREQKQLAEDTVFPRLMVFEESYSPNTSRTDAATGEQIAVVEGAIAADADSAELTAHRLRADMVRSLLGLARQNFDAIESGGVLKVEITGERDITRRPEGMAILVVQVRVKLACVERVSP